MLPLKEEIAAGGEVKLGSNIESPEEFVERRESKEILTKAINSLPAKQRICVILRDIQGFSYIEISDILECSLGTVKSRLYRGRRALKANLEDSELFFYK